MSIPRLPKAVLSVCSLLALAHPCSAQNEIEKTAPSNVVDSAILESVIERAVTAGFEPRGIPQLILLAQSQNPPVNQPQGPASIPSPPSLGDLGITPDQSQGSAADQARLDRRSHMLKMHQRFGLITLGAMAATIAVSGLASGKNSSAVGRDIHGGVGAVTADMYFMAAYYAIRAPRIPGTPVRGPIRLHKALAWVHGPGMILTPILGAMALAQEQNGEKVHGIAKAHSAVAAVTYTSFGLAFLSVAIKF